MSKSIIDRLKAEEAQINAKKGPSVQAKPGAPATAKSGASGAPVLKHGGDSNGKVIKIATKGHRNPEDHDKRPPVKP